MDGFSLQQNNFKDYKKPKAIERKNQNQLESDLGTHVRGRICSSGGRPIINVGLCHAIVTKQNPGYKNFFHKLSFPIGELVIIKIN